MLHGTGCYGNTEAVPDPVAAPEAVPSKLRPEVYETVRQSRKSTEGSVSRSWQGLVNGQERASDSGIQKPASGLIPYSGHFLQAVTLQEKKRALSRLPGRDCLLTSVPWGVRDRAIKSGSEGVSR